jgi:DNA-binding XRE family transcriptional regulator
MKTSSDTTISTRGAAVAKGLGRKIRTARQARGFTQSELAERARTSLPTVVRMESGQPGTALGIWINVLEVLGMLQGLEALSDPMSEIAGRSALDRRIRNRQSTADLDF